MKNRQTQRHRTRHIVKLFVSFLTLNADSRIRGSNPESTDTGAPPPI